MGARGSSPGYPRFPLGAGTAFAGPYTQCGCLLWSTSWQVYLVPFTSTPVVPSPAVGQNSPPWMQVPLLVLVHITAGGAAACGGGTGAWVPGAGRGAGITGAMTGGWVTTAGGGGAAATRADEGGGGGGGGAVAGADGAVAGGVVVCGLGVTAAGEGVAVAVGAGVALAAVATAGRPRVCDEVDPLGGAGDATAAITATQVRTAKALTAAVPVRRDLEG